MCRCGCKQVCINQHITTSHARVPQRKLLDTRLANLSRSPAHINELSNRLATATKASHHRLGRLRQLRKPPSTAPSSVVELPACLTAQGVRSSSTSVPAIHTRASRAPSVLPTSGGEPRLEFTAILRAEKLPCVACKHEMNESLTRSLGKTH